MNFDFTSLNHIKYCKKSIEEYFLQPPSFVYCLFLFVPSQTSHDFADLVQKDAFDELVCLVRTRNVTRALLNGEYKVLGGNVGGKVAELMTERCPNHVLAELFYYAVSQFPYCHFCKGLLSFVKGNVPGY